MGRGDKVRNMSNCQSSPAAATLLVLLSICAAGAVLGEDSKTIEVRTIGIPPYGIASGAHASGFYYDVANLLAEGAGYSVTNRIYPYARIVNELKTGQTDMTIMFKYKELEEHVTYVSPLPALETVVIGLQGTRISSIADLKGKTLAYLRGAKFSDEIDGDPEITKQVTHDFAQGARMLAFGRVDAIIGPLAPILSAVDEIDDPKVVLATPYVVAERTPWIQISNKSVGRLSAQKLRHVFDDLVGRGVIEELRKEYLRP